MKLPPSTPAMPGAGQILTMPITHLTPYQNNARTHSAKQIRQIAKSIETFGFTNPVLIDGDNRIVAGHGRVEAAKLLGLTEVPTLRLDSLTEAQIRAYIIADNKIAENAGWDKSILAIEVQYLSTLNPDFDLDIIGFEMAEIDLLIDGDPETAADPADDVPEPAEGNPVTQLGDIWHCGKHRLLCGNAVQVESYTALMGEDKAHAIFTDPPYNVKINGHVCGLGRVKHPEFVMGSGEMSGAQQIDFLKTVGLHLTAYSHDGSLHFICMDWRHILELLTAGKAAYTELKNICVWNKDNGGMGSLYRSKHEFVAVFKHGTKPHLNNIELGKHGRYRTNVWDYAGVNTIRKDRMAELAMHPTVKPVRMVADAIKDCTKRGQIVLDPFAGSGTTLIAAEQTGRIARCMELDPIYCDTILRRWQQLTGQEATHVATGLTFAQQAGKGGGHD